MLRGSARSIESVNIFEALKACSQYIEEFGGHSQAAGVNVKAENFEALKLALDEYLATHYSREDFAPVLPVCGEAKDFKRVAHEMDLLEPFGVGNRRPQFVLSVAETEASPLKPLSPHLSLNVNRFELMSFNGSKHLKALRSDLPKKLVFDYNVSTFRGRESVKGFVRTVVCDALGGKNVELDLYENRLLAASLPPLPAAEMQEEELNALLAEKLSACAYGLCAVCYDRRSLKKYPALAGVPAEVFRLSSGSVENAVLISPDPETDLSAYRDIVFLDVATRIGPGNAKLFRSAPPETDRGLQITRAELLGIFSRLKEFEGAAVGESLADAARGMRALNVNPYRLVFALAVFRELGLISLKEGRLFIVRGKKTELNRSAVYRAVIGKREG